eukprot:1159869-Pelagomonas_calceolata.AAC.5
MLRGSSVGVSKHGAWQHIAGHLRASMDGQDGAHAVSAVSFSASGSLLVTASEDTLVSVWVTHELLDASMDTSAPTFTRPEALYSWCVPGGVEPVQLSIF